MDISPLLLGKSKVAHTTLFHPLSGSCGSGPMGAARWMTRGHAYKTMHHSGGAAGCWEQDHKQRDSKSYAKCIVHEPPLLFDLSVDPGESKPLDTSAGSAGAKVLATMATQLSAQLASIAKGPNSAASYAHGTAGTASNCCSGVDGAGNPKNIECRCHNGTGSGSSTRPPTAEQIYDSF